MCEFSAPDLRPVEIPNADWRIYRGVSMSMVFVPGDLLRVEKLTAAQVLPGDIIVFDSPRGTVTVHRVIEKSAAGALRTMGDNNPGPDFAPIPPDTTVCRVVEVRRGDGKLEAVSRGAAGMAEFRRNRRRRWWHSELSRYAAGVCRRIWPFKRRLKTFARFGDEVVFYAGDTPVVRRDADGRLHWSSPWHRVIYRID